jgi:hypothetical protein
MARDVLEGLIGFVQQDILDHDSTAQGQGAAAGGAPVVDRQLVEGRDESGVETLLGDDRERLAVGIHELDVALVGPGERPDRPQDLFEPSLERVATPETRARLAQARERRRLRGDAAAALAQLFLGLLTLRDVPCDLGRADDLALRVPDRRYRDRDRDPPPVLGDAGGLEMVDALSRADPLDDPGFLVVQFRRDDRGDVLADDLRGQVAENPGGTAVPRLDDAVQGLADDGVIRRFDDGGEQGA